MSVVATAAIVAAVAASNAAAAAHRQYLNELRTTCPTNYRPECDEACISQKVTDTKPISFLHEQQTFVNVNSCLNTQSDPQTQVVMTGGEIVTIILIVVAVIVGVCALYEN